MVEVFFVAGFERPDDRCVRLGLPRAAAGGVADPRRAAGVPAGTGCVAGVNLTYYGFFMATACAAAAALWMVLLGSLGVPAWATTVLAAATLGLCLPAANLVARRVEKNDGALSVAGAFIVGFAAVPAMVPLLNLSLGGPFGFHLPWLPTLTAVAIAYALGEGIGRLARGAPVAERTLRDRAQDRDRRGFHGAT